MGDGQAGVRLLEHPWQQAEVEVLDKDEGRVRAHLLEHGLCEQAIDLPIALPVVRVVSRPGEGDVTEWPEPAVGQAVVESFLLLGGEPDPSERVARVLGGHANAVVLIDHRAIGITAAVPHPGPVAGEHHRVQGGSHAARRTN